MRLTLVALLLVAAGLSITEGAFPSQASFTFNNVKGELEELDSVEDSQLPDYLDIPEDTDTTSLKHSTSLRMSKALNEAAANYKETITGVDRSGVSCPETPSSNVNSEDDEVQYIHQPGFFNCFLEHRWGVPNIADVDSPSDIDGQKGILVFLDCSDDTVQNHVDLWDGEECILHSCPESYFTSDCTTVRFYQLS